MAADTWLIVGLGNPGRGYASTRHNVGQMVADELGRRLGSRFSRHKANALVAEGRLVPGGPKLVVAKSMSYMNTSGGPVSALLSYYSLDVDRLIVIHDDLDIPFESLKLKIGGGHGGHNGLRDIGTAASAQFTRVRVGVGRPPGRQDAADYVLRPFSRDERAALPSVIADAADAVELIVDDGLVAAQQKVHAPRT